MNKGYLTDSEQADVLDYLRGLVSAIEDGLFVVRSIRVLSSKDGIVFSTGDKDANKFITIQMAAIRHD